MLRGTFYLYCHVWENLAPALALAPAPVLLLVLLLLSGFLLAPAAALARAVLAFALALALAPTLASAVALALAPALALASPRFNTAVIRWDDLKGICWNVLALIGGCLTNWEMITAKCC